MAFVPLRVYSGFSYLSSGNKAELLPSLAKKRGYDSLGISDKGSLSGYAPFAHAAKKMGVRPIYGMDYKTELGTFTLFAKVEAGYRNLCLLSYSSSIGKGDYETLVKHSSGLIAILSLDEYPSFDDLGQKDGAAMALRNALAPFENSYLGLPYKPDDPSFTYKARSFARSYSYPLVALPHILYPKKEDAIVLSIVKAISDKTFIDQKSEEGNNHFLSPDEVSSFYGKEEIDLSEEIANMCSFELIRRRGKLLHYENNEGLSSDEYLKKLAYEGLKRKQGEISQEYESRLLYELGVIANMGYSDYFLIVADYVNYAKNNGISVGPGRGSGAGSLVSYALNIVSPDPIKFGLLFERFLNPERQTMPDIDVDFSDLRREEVVRYLREKYGQNRVAHVLATQTIGAKEALTDIGRVYRYKENEVKLVKDRIINDRWSLRDDYRNTKQFRDLIDSDKYYLEMVSLAAKIEGLPRQASIHAAGVLLNAEPLMDIIPVSYNSSVGLIANLEKDYLEEQGFLKMDILGLKNLSTIDLCLELAKNNGKNAEDAASIPYDDEEAIKLIAEGKTMGLFQLESPGMKKAISTLKPNRFEDVAALLALFRPGPMQSIDSYARRKAGLEPIRYPAPELSSILKETYGIIVYQEQIMQIARVYSGFSYGEADLLRRAISKKDASKLIAMKDKFLEGALALGHSQKEAEDIYALIERFADYGFNKSHAVAYAMLTCQMAYLKRKYPEEFYCAVLSSLPSDSSKFKTTVSEARSLGLTLALPDVNLSEYAFSASDKKLRLPISAIKGFPSLLAKNIVDEREENGPYLDFFDFVVRAKKIKLSSNNIVKLIDAGALDSLYPSRASLRHSLQLAYSYAEMMYGDNGEALLELDIEKPTMENMRDDIVINLEAEYEALGLMISSSPLALYKDEISQYRDLIPLHDAEERYDEVKTAAIIKSIRSIKTRKGQNMAFLEIYDEDSEISLVAFPDCYERHYPYLKENKVHIFVIRKDRERENSYVLLDVIPLGDKK